MPAEWTNSENIKYSVEEGGGLSAGVFIVRAEVDFPAAYLKHGVDGPNDLHDAAYERLVQLLENQQAHQG